VNQWWKPRNGEAGSNLADVGRCAAHDHLRSDVDVDGVGSVVDSEAD